MAKSTLDSLEKLLLKYIAPLEQKFATVMKELKKLEDKIDNLEGKNPAPKNEAQAGSSKMSKPTANPRNSLPVNTPTQTQSNRSQRAPEKGHTHTATPPTAASVVARTVAPARLEPVTQPAPAQVAGHDHVCTTPQGAAEIATNDPSSTDKNWTTVSRRNKKPHTRRNAITGSGTADNELQTVERVRRMHICFLKQDTTPESLVSYMRRKNPSDDYHVEKLKLSHNHYSSFSVTVPFSRFEFFMSPENWPPRIEVSEWFRRSVGRADGASTQPRGRRASTALVAARGKKTTAGAATTSSGTTLL